MVYQQWWMIPMFQAIHYIQCCHVIRVGTIQSKVLMEWGCTSDFEELCASRREDTRMPERHDYRCGTHDSKVLESSMDWVCQGSACPSCKPLSTHDRYFYGPRRRWWGVLRSFQKYIETRFRSITSSRVREQVQWSMAVKMHRIYIQTFTHRKTKVAHRDRKDKKEKERTKTKALDLEILKMQMAMKFPFRILQRIE
jgi:hypothetical protein